MNLIDSGQGEVTGSCKCDDDPKGFSATDLLNYIY